MNKEMKRSKRNEEKEEVKGRIKRNYQTWQHAQNKKAKARQNGGPA